MVAFFGSCYLALDFYRTMDDINDTNIDKYVSG